MGRASKGHYRRPAQGAYNRQQARRRPSEQSPAVTPLIPHTPPSPSVPARRRFLAGLALAAAGPARAEFKIEVTGVGATRIPVAVAPFRDEDRSRAPTSAIVRADLERSGLFKPLDARSGLDETLAFNAADWRAQGADALLAGSMQRLEIGRAHV